MKKYAILRDVSPTMSWEDADAAALQNLVNMQMGIGVEDSFEPRILGVKWVRSYWARGTDWGLCLYTAPNEDNVRRWHDWCEVPYVEIREVAEKQASHAVPYESGWHAGPDESGLVVIEGTEELVHSVPGARWIRTYLDSDRGVATALYDTSSTGADSIAQLESKGLAVHRVVEVKPSDYGVEYVETPANA